MVALLTCNLPSPLSYGRRFCSHSSSLAAPFTPFQIPYHCFYVSVWLCSHSVFWDIYGFQLPGRTFVPTFCLFPPAASSTLGTISVQPKIFQNLGKIQSWKIKLCDSVVLVSAVQLISRRILIIVSRRGLCGVKSSLFITGRHIP